MASERDRPILAGLTVLIVEDRYLVADDLRRICDRQGAAVTLLASNVEEAAGLAAHEALGLAILDIDLRGQDVFATAETLAGRGVPFVFVTGYPRTRLPAAFRDRPLVSKPFSQAELVAGIERVLAPPEPESDRRH